MRDVVGEPLVEVLDRQAPQLGDWGVDLSETPYILGSRVITSAEAAVISPAEATAIATPDYREPFGMPAARG